MFIPRNAPTLVHHLDRLSPHLTLILDGALRSFSDNGNPLRFAFAGMGLRELLREIFRKLAPDEEIKKCMWFVPDETSSSGVTRRHRTTFSVYSYISSDKFPVYFASGVDALADEILGIVKALSAFTHVTEGSLCKTEQEAKAVAEQAVSLFIRLFEAVEDARTHLHCEVEAYLAVELSVFFTTDFFDDLDALSTHTRVKDAELLRVNLEKIAPEFLQFSGSGVVTCDLQYGSDGDCARGDGIEWSDSFPFTFTGYSDLSRPYEVRIEPSDVQINTSKYEDTSHFHEDAC